MKDQPNRTETKTSLSSRRKRRAMWGLLILLGSMAAVCTTVSAEIVLRTEFEANMSEDPVKYQAASMPYYVEKASTCYWTPASQGTGVFASASKHESYNDPKIKLFNYKGDLLGESFSFGFSYSNTSPNLVVMTDESKLFLATTLQNQQSVIVPVTLTRMGSSGLLLFKPEPESKRITKGYPTYSYNTAVSVPGTDYVYFAGYVPYNYNSPAFFVQRLNTKTYSASVVSIGGTETMYSGFNAILAPKSTAKPFVLVRYIQEQQVAQLSFLRRADLFEEKVVEIPGQVNMSWSYAMLNNLNDDQMYFVEANPSGKYYLVAYDLSFDRLLVTQLTGSQKLFQQRSHEFFNSFGGMLNFGPFEYFGYTLEGPTDLNIIDKRSFVKVAKTFRIPHPTNALFGQEVRGLEVFFAAHYWNDRRILQAQESSNHFQSYSLKFDCLERSLANEKICAKCPENHALSSAAQDNYCSDLASLAQMNQGIDPSTGLVVSCTTNAGCSRCESTDYRSCLECISGMERDLVSGRCMSPPNMGLDRNSVGGPSVKRCQDEHCQDCTADFAVCLRCSYSSLLKEGKCVPSQASLQVVKSFYSLSTNTAQIRFDKAISLKEADLFDIWIVDETTNEKIMCNKGSKTACDISLNRFNDGFDVKIRHSSTILKGKLVLVPSSSFPPLTALDSSMTPTYPLVVPAVRYSNGSFRSRSTTFFTSSILGLRTIGNFGVINFSPLLGNTMDKVLADLGYLPLLNGDILMYPSIVLSYLTDSIFYIPFPNWFTDFLFDGNCRPNDIYAKNGYSCNMLFNFGSDLLLLLLQLLANGTVTILCRVVFSRALTDKEAMDSEHDQDEPAEQSKQEQDISSLPQPKPPSTCEKINAHFHRSYGLPVFVMKLSGSYMAIIQNAMLGLTSKLAPWSLFLSFSVSLMFVALYILLIIKIYAMNKSMLKCISQLPKAEIERLTLKPTRMLRFLEKSEAKIDNHYLLYLYEDSKFTADRLKMFEPLIFFGRGLLIYVCLVLFSASGSTQLFVVLLIEVLYSGYVLKSNNQYRRLGIAITVINRVLFPLYVLVRFCANFTSTERARQEHFGWTLAALLITIVCCNIVYFIAESIMAFWRLVTNWRKKSHKVHPATEAKASNGALDSSDVKELKEDNRSMKTEKVEGKKAKQAFVPFVDRMFIVMQQRLRRPN